MTTPTQETKKRKIEEIVLDDSADDDSNDEIRLVFYHPLQIIITLITECKGGCKEDYDDGFGHYMFHERWAPHMMEINVALPESIRNPLNSVSLYNHIRDNWKQYYVAHGPEIGVTPTEFEGKSQYAHQPEGGTDWHHVLLTMAEIKEFNSKTPCSHELRSAIQCGKTGALPSIIIVDESKDSDTESEDSDDESKDSDDEGKESEEEET